jgi:hypothetical protein
MPRSVSPTPCRLDRIAGLFVAAAAIWFAMLVAAEKCAMAQASVQQAVIPVYDAARLTRGGRIAPAIRTNEPDVLVVRNVSSFAALLRLRNTLGLHGYAAAMSNFICGSRPGVPSVDVGVLSRQPIEEAAEYDAPGTHCVISGPFVAGPGAAVHERRNVSSFGWPHVAKLGQPIPGPGILAVRISGEAQPLVLVRLPTTSDYLVEGRAAVEKMRAALQGDLHGKGFAGCRTSGCRTVTIDPDSSAEPGIRTAMR